jgi:hypothetical protein
VDGGNGTGVVDLLDLVDHHDGLVRVVGGSHHRTAMYLPLAHGCPFNVVDTPGYRS